jgi:hypothetical protein
MIFTLLETGAVASLAVYLGCWRVSLHRRRARAWHILEAHLQPKRCAPELADQSSWDEQQIVMPEETWGRIEGANDLWKMYQNAGVMLNMADFAARNSDSVDGELLSALRNDAMQIRACVLTALAKYACSQVNESTCVSVSRAATFYADMVARTVELLRVNGGLPVSSLA